MKKGIFLLIGMVVFCFANIENFTYATNAATPNNLHIIPEAREGNGLSGSSEIVQRIGSGDGHTTVIERYNKEADLITEKGDIGKAFETGVMNWDTLINYVIYLMRFLNQIGLLIGGVMILYAGYLYATYIFGFGDPNKGKNAMKNAIIGVLVIIFSYAIWKGLEQMFL